MQRPPEDTPMVCLPITVTPSLSEALNKLQSAPGNKLSSNTRNSDVVNVGDSCKNSGCNEVYSGSDGQDSVCQHHPGCPVFHEGCKYWSCCQRKTSDFSAFLAQEGCERGKHKWITPKSEQS